MALEPRFAALLARALSAPAPFARAIATDADGTLWTRDVGDTLFLHAADTDAISGRGLAKLRAHGQRLLGDACDGDAGPIAHALFRRYEAGRITVREMCDLQAEILGDRPRAALLALVDTVAHQIAQTVRPQVRALLREAHALGVGIHVVSGSLALGVEAALRRADIPFDGVFGAVLAERDGHMLADLRVPAPLYEGKVTALRGAGAGVWPAALGLGDGEWDHTFLREVYLPTLVHPKPSLREAMRGVERVTVLD